MNVLNDVCGIHLEETQIRLSSGALSIWNKFAISQNLDQDIQLDIAKEFSSSIKWQGMFADHSIYQHESEQSFQLIRMNILLRPLRSCLLVSSGNSPSSKAILLTL